MPILVERKKVRLDYDILEEWEAGISLHGFEVKTLRAKHGSLEGARVLVRGGEAFLVGADIPAFQKNNAPKDFDPLRNRKLLLNKEEIARLASQESQKGLTIVPISLYTKNRHIKLSLGLARSKKKHDKRETIKKRDTARDVEREIKSRFQ